MKNVNVEIINGVSKNGQPYKCLEWSLITSTGVYTARSYPTSLEMGIIEKTLAKTKEIYGEENNDNLF